MVAEAYFSTKRTTWVQWRTAFQWEVPAFISSIWLTYLWRKLHLCWGRVILSPQGQVILRGKTENTLEGWCSSSSSTRMDRGWEELAAWQQLIARWLRKICILQGCSLVIFLRPTWQTAPLTFREERLHLCYAVLLQEQLCVLPTLEQRTGLKIHAARSIPDTQWVVIELKNARQDGHIHLILLSRSQLFIWEGTGGLSGSIGIFFEDAATEKNNTVEQTSKKKNGNSYEDELVSAHQESGMPLQNSFIPHSKTKTQFSYKQTKSMTRHLRKLYLKTR